MKKTFGYYLLLVATWPMQFFPLGFHHFFSDVLYLIIYKMAGYRKRVVAENLRNAFPEKTESERKKIEKSFYQKFADLFIDTLYFTHTPFKRIKKRLVIENLELLRSLISANRNLAPLVQKIERLAVGNQCSNLVPLGHPVKIALPLF